MTLKTHFPITLADLWPSHVTHDRYALIALHLVLRVTYIGGSLDDAGLVFLKAPLGPESITSKEHNREILDWDNSAWTMLRTPKRLRKTLGRNTTWEAINKLVTYGRSLKKFNLRGNLRKFNM